MNPDATLRLQRELRARQPDWKEAEAALRDGADRDTRMPDKNGIPLLASVSGAGRVDHVRWLLAHGANPNAVDESGWTALMYAVLCCHTKIVGPLLEAGTDPNALDDAGNTALMLAITNTQPKCDTGSITRLIDHGADPAVLDSMGRTIPEIGRAHDQANKVEALDAALARPTHVAARRRLLARLSQERQTAWLPRSCAAETEVIATKTWRRRP